MGIGENLPGNRGNIGFPAMIGDHDGPERPKRGDLRRIESGAAQQPRNQNKR